MIQRFFFYRVYTVATGASIRGEHNLAFNTGAHKAQAALALVQFTFTRADITLNPAIVETVPVFCWHHAGIIQ